MPDEQDGPSKQALRFPLLAEHEATLRTLGANVLRQSFEVLAEERVIPRSEHRPWIHGGRDYFGHTVEFDGPLSKALEAAIPDRFVRGSIDATMDYPWGYGHALLEAAVASGTSPRPCGSRPAPLRLPWLRSRGSRATSARCTRISNRTFGVRCVSRTGQSHLGRVTSPVWRCFAAEWTNGEATTMSRSCTGFARPSSTEASPRRALSQRRSAGSATQRSRATWASRSKSRSIVGETFSAEPSSSAPRSQLRSHSGLSRTPLTSIAYCERKASEPPGLPISAATGQTSAWHQRSTQSYRFGSHSRQTQTSRRMTTAHLKVLRKFETHASKSISTCVERGRPSIANGPPRPHFEKPISSAYLARRSTVGQVAHQHGYQI